MFKKIEAFSKDKHQDLRLTQTNSFEFARSVLSAPLSRSEFSIALHHYPIVFPLEMATPLVLFALSQKTNNYINNDGVWKVPYVPAYIRRYPFTLANNTTAKSNNNLVVCIDVDAPHFTANQGEPLFTADGELADISQNTIKFLQKFQEELNVTQALCQELEAQKVLVEKTVTIEKNGVKSSVGGFRCVDMEKLNALEDSVLAKWVRNGLMGLIVIHQLSLSNLKSLT